jgi:hypothetical protein
MTSTTIWMSVLITGSAVLMAVVIGAGFYRSAKEPEGTGNRPAVTWLVLGLLGVWLVLALALSVSDFFIPGPGQRVPRLAYTLIPLAAGVGLLGFSPAFRRAIGRTPQPWLIGVQFSRILGGIFLIGYAQGTFPGEFALPAGIGDVLVGLLAPVVAALVATNHPWSRQLAVLWNIAGLTDLALAVTLGVLSSPGPLQRLAFDTPNAAISTYPFVLIPAFLVPLLILVHLYSLHGLVSNRGAMLRPKAQPAV